MRTIITFVLCLSLFSVSYAQDKKVVNPKIEELPEVFITHTKKDISKYIPDNNPDAVVRNTQNQFVSYKVDEDCKNYDEYLVTLENEKGFLVATYDQKGTLLRVNEKYTNVELPRAVINFVYMTYPEWTITKSKFEYSQQTGEVLKKAYHLKLKKDNQTQTISISASGKTVKTNIELAMN